MKINGLQKLTLLDYPEHTACTVFLAGCDLRCPFCHNSELINGDAPAVMEEEELFRFLSGRKGILDGVAFTGGEPILRPELPEVMKRIREEGFLVKLDTNGTHPDRLERIIREGLADYIAMDIKNSPERYAETSGVEHLDTEKISRSIFLIIGSGIAHEFRTTVTEQLHSKESFEKIGPWIEGADRYYLQAFTDRETVRYAGFSAPDQETLAAYAEIVRPFVKTVGVRGV